VVNLAGGRSTTVLAAIEGPESDEVTLECTDLSMGEPSGFTFSVHSSILVEMAADQLDTLEKFGGDLSVSTGDDQFGATIHPDRYGHGNALISVRNESTGEELATIVAIRGQEGFTFGILEVLVPSSTDVWAFR
jgi:hypothetical protein